MKLSLNWIKNYLEIPYTPEELSVILTALGLEVEKVEKFISVKGGLDGIVVGQVVESIQHPNADRLSLNQVLVGDNHTLQIVCGANNIAKDQKVLVAPVGATIHPTNGEPWQIKKGKIRGEFSEGMICSEDELSLGDNHDGIVVLDQEAKVGDPARNYFDISEDTIFHIDLTPNRSDATSHLGVAKDLLAYLRIHGFENLKIDLPHVQNFRNESRELEIDVQIEDIEGCPRYSGVGLRNVEIKDSPDWLKTHLRSIGVRPINNVVDITNFVLHETGQPLHAFDADKIEGSTIVVKNLPEGTHFVTLDEQERKLNSEDLMICNGNDKGLCIAGVFGGIDSGVTESTKNIFLESAHFNAKRIRRTSTRHLLRTDAAMIFEKGSDPEMTVYALKRAALLMKELANAEIASEVVDVNPKPILPKDITLEYQHINQLIGIELSRSEVHAILKALGIDILIATDEMIKVQIPTNKPEVTRPADVIEEILRIHGFNNVPVDNTMQTTLQFSGKISLNQLKRELAIFLTSRGWFEMMNLSLSQSKYYKEYLPEYENQLIYIHNTSNIHLDVMRPEMLCPVMESILYNQNRQGEKLNMYEFGRSYLQIDGEVSETEKMTLVIKGPRNEESWHLPDSGSVDFFDLKREIIAVFNKLGVAKLNYAKEEKDDRFILKASYYGNQSTPLVELGQVSDKLAKNFGIKDSIYYAEFDMEQLLDLVKERKIRFQEIGKFPGTRRDLALILNESVQFTEIEKLTAKLNHRWIAGINLFDVYRNEKQLGPGKKSYAVSFEFEDHSKTLKDKEVDKIMKKLILLFEKELHATIRK